MAVHDAEDAGDLGAPPGQPRLEFLDLVDGIAPAVGHDEHMGRVPGEFGVDAGLRRVAPAVGPGEPRVREPRLLPLREEDRGPVPLAQAALDQVGQNLAAPGAGRPENEIDQGLVIGRDQDRKVLSSPGLRKEEPGGTRVTVVWAQHTVFSAHGLGK